MDLGEKILTKKHLKALYIKDWDETVYIKKLSGLKIIEHQQKLANIDENNEVEAYKYLIDLLILSLCDEKGEQLFNETHKESLIEQGFNTIQTLVKEVQAYNGIGINSIEDAEKN